MSEQDNQKPSPPNPFTCARRISGVHVRLSPGDLASAEPGIGEAEAARLLDRRASRIAQRMLHAGREAAIQIIREGGTA